jgi:hypothetical protein
LGGLCAIVAFVVGRFVALWLGGTEPVDTLAVAMRLQMCRGASELGPIAGAAPQYEPLGV